MSTKDLLEALNGPQGAMDCYLEVRTDAEIKADIKALVGDKQREHFAAMAMQGLMSDECITHKDRSEFAVAAADALIAELAKVKS